MNLLVLDFETYYDQDYTLKKMTTEAYVRDERFEAHGVGLHFVNHDHSEWIDGRLAGAALKAVDWNNTALLCHHAQFDGLILEHHYGIRPAFWYDTLSMARLLLGVHLPVGLDALAKMYSLAAKTVPYNEFRGLHWSDIVRTGDLARRLAAGCLHDCALTFDIFKRLKDQVPHDEYHHIDSTIRMFTEPVLEGDIDMLGAIWREENGRRLKALNGLNANAKEIGSNEVFIKMLEAEGVEVEFKTGKNGLIPAFAKTDQFMEELLEHDNPRVAALAAARLGLKSTIDQTRAERFGFMASRGRMPVYLRYAGAHTTRWAGGDKVNWQNLRRGGKLRKAVGAPQGCTLVIADSSQIECRILNEFAGQDDVIEKFRTGQDPYIGIASQAYERPITKADTAERGTGKQLELSCGYGAGAGTIQKTARLGVYGPAVEIDLQTAERWKDLYRVSHPRVTALWREAETVLRQMHGFLNLEWGCLEIRSSERLGHRRIRLPGQADLIYDTLEWYIPTEHDPAWLEQGWRVKTRRGWPTKMYGAKLVENVVQYMARMHLAEAKLRIEKNHGIRIATTTHDELVAVVPLDKGQEAFKIMLHEMCVPPSWMPNLPLAAEGVVSQRYDK